jgi:hypothetical protein
MLNLEGHSYGPRTWEDLTISGPCEKKITKEG